MICGGHSGEVVPFDIIPFFRAQQAIIGSFVYKRDEVERARARAPAGRSCRSSTDLPARGGRARRWTLMERREHFGKIVVTP